MAAALTGRKAGSDEKELEERRVRIIEQVCRQKIVSKLILGDPRVFCGLTGVSLQN
jgi:hypothetical protein